MPNYFEEAEHPRAGKGSPTGGQFVSKGGGGETGAEHTEPSAPLALQKYEPDWSKIYDPKLRASAQYGVIAWSTGMYDDINTSLRSGDGMDWTTGSVQREIRGLNRAFEAAHELEQDTIVYRGVGADFASKLKVGASWVDRGFTATAPGAENRKWADKFAVQGGALLEIMVPKGTRAIAPLVTDLDPLTIKRLKREGIPEADAEAISGGAEPELLLDRGTRFTVIGQEGAVFKVAVTSDTVEHIKPIGDVYAGPLPSQAISVNMGRRYPGKKMHEVLVNPTKSEVRSLAKETKYGEVRIMQDVYKNAYVWSGDEIIHSDMTVTLIENFGLDPDQFKGAEDGLSSTDKIVGRSAAIIEQGQETAKQATMAEHALIDKSQAKHQIKSLEKLNIAPGVDMDLTKASEPLLKAGFRSGALEDAIPEDMMEQLTDKETDIKQPDKVPELQALSGKAFADALNDIDGTIMEGIKDHVGELAVVYASYKPRGAAMTTVTGPGGAVFLINTSCDYANAFARPEQIGSYSARKGYEDFKKSGDLKKAVMLQSRLAAVHEFAHLADAVTGHGLTETFTEAVLLESKAENARQLGQWLTKNISKYACAAPNEAMAEAVSIFVHEGKLPGILNTWAKQVVDRHGEVRRRKAA